MRDRAVGSRRFRAGLPVQITRTSRSFRRLLNRARQHDYRERDCDERGDRGTHTHPHHHRRPPAFPTVGHHKPLLLSYPPNARVASIIAPGSHRRATQTIAIPIATPRIKKGSFNTNVDTIGSESSVIFNSPSVLQPGPGIDRCPSGCRIPDRLISFLPGFHDRWRAPGRPRLAPIVPKSRG